MVGFGWWGCAKLWFLAAILLDFRVSSVLQSLLLEGVAFRGCGRRLSEGWNFQP